MSEANKRSGVKDLSDTSVATDEVNASAQTFRHRPHLVILTYYDFVKG